MKKISVSELKAGMTFDQPVFIDPENVLAGSLEAIKKEDLEHLNKCGIQEVKTNGKVFNSATGNTIVSASKGSTLSISIYEKELLILKIKKQYENFRQKISPFAESMRDTSRTLGASFSALLTKKRIEKQTINQIGINLATEISAAPMLLILLQYTKFNSNWTLHHLIHATSYGIILGKALGYSKVDLERLSIAMLLMDMGMFAIPASIREKGGALETHETKLVHAHPVFAYRLLSSSDTIEISLANLAMQHHEAYDGSGYPRGLKGKNIDQSAMLAGICDSYTAMIEPRPYRKALLPSIAIKNMLAKASKRFDPQLLRTFIKELSIYPIGSFVKLNNGCIGMVIGSHPEKPTFPIIRLIRDPSGKPYPSLHFLDLAYEATTRINAPILPDAAGITPAKEL